MPADTPIEWTDATWNTVGGCDLHSPGCRRCYAMKLAGTRLKHHPLHAGTTTPSASGPVFNGHLTRLPPDHRAWSWPLRWRGTRNPKLGPFMPAMIFVADLSDLFHHDRPVEDIDRTVAALLYSRHIGQLLTKRADRMRDYFAELKASARWLDFKHPLLGMPVFDPAVATYERVFRRLWLGVSVERQAEADERIPLLLATPAQIRFVSCEPQLGPVSLSRYMWPVCAWWPSPYQSPEEASAAGAKVEYKPQGLVSAGRRFLDWVIGGGESGDGRPYDLAWGQALAVECERAGVAYFQKQVGSKPVMNGAPLRLAHKKGGDPEEWPADLRVRRYPSRAAMERPA